MKTAEEFGQALQNIIDRHRQDLSILLRDYGYNGHITPEDLVMLYQHDHPMLLLNMQELPLNDEDLCHMEGETTLDKLSNLFSKGIDLVRNVGTTADKIQGSSQTETAPPVADTASKKSKTQVYFIVGAVAVIILTVILIRLKRKK